MLSFIKKLLTTNSEAENFGLENIDATMKYLIVGLGNIGSKYDNTRHNIGFDVIDQLVKEHEVEMKEATHGKLGVLKHKGRSFLLLKPNTYMNLSGKAVRYWLTKEKIPNSNLLVILDDLNLDFGKVRLRGKGSPGGHNGLKNIDQLLGGNKYARLRLGIGNSFGKGKQVNFVLGEWDHDEAAELPNILEHAAKAILAFGTIGLQHTMNQYNKK